MSAENLVGLIVAVALIGFRPDPGRVLELVEEHTMGRTLGFLGEPGVNVLELNLAMDQEFPER